MAGKLVKIGKPEYTDIHKEYRIMELIASISSVLGVLCSLVVLLTFRNNMKQTKEAEVRKQVGQENQIDKLAEKLDDLNKTFSERFQQLQAALQDIRKEVNCISLEHELLINQHEQNHPEQSIRRR